MTSVKLKTEDIKIFSQTYNAAGGIELFPSLRPLGFINIYCNKKIIRDKYGEYNRTELEDIIAQITIEVPIETNRAELERDRDDVTYDNLYIKTSFLEIVKRALVEKHITHVFNYKNINPYSMQGDAYQIKYVDGFT